MLARIAGGYRLQTHPDLAPYVERFANRDVSHRLSTAALETLAIVAYRQPVSRGQISVAARRQRRRRDPPARAARLHRGGGPGRGTGPAGRSSAPPTSSWSASASTRSDQLPPVEDFLPGPDVAGEFEEDLRRDSVGDGIDIGVTGCRRRRGIDDARGWAESAPSGGRAAAEGAGPGGFRARRRVCEDLIAAGRVTVDGAVAELGRRVDVATARVEVDGVLLPVAPGLVYYLLNKPAGVVTTASDTQGRRTVLDLVPAEPRVFPVGRLDLATEGLLILTNDGALAQLLTHPSHGVEKEYVAEVDGGTPAAGALRSLRQGVELEDGRTAPAGVGVAGPRCAAAGHPRGQEPPGPPHVRGRRPPGPTAGADPDRPVPRHRTGPGALAGPDGVRGAGPGCGGRAGRDGRDLSGLSGGVKVGVRYDSPSMSSLMQRMPPSVLRAGRHVVDALPSSARGRVRSLLGVPARLAGPDGVPVGAPRGIPLSTLDAELAEAARLFLVSEDQARQFLDGFYVSLPVDSPADPFSDAYREWTWNLYRRVSGRRHATPRRTKPRRSISPLRRAALPLSNRVSRRRRPRLVFAGAPDADHR